jgi:hypothetical protein
MSDMNTDKLLIGLECLAKVKTGQTCEGKALADFAYSGNYPYNNCIQPYKTVLGYAAIPYYRNFHWGFDKHIFETSHWMNPWI